MKDGGEECRERERREQRGFYIHERVSLPSGLVGGPCVGPLLL